MSPGECCIQSSWSVLPLEIAERIMLSVNPADFRECARVSKSWYAYFQDDTLWKRLLSVHYGRKINAFPACTGTFRKDFLLCYSFQNTPTPENEKVTATILPDHESSVRKCIFSPSGKYLLVHMGSKLKEQLQVIFVDDDFRSKVILDFPIDDENRPVLPSRLKGSFNRTEELLLMCIDADKRSLECRVFQIPSFEISQELVFDPEPFWFCDAQWLGDYTVIYKHIYHNDAPIIWSVTTGEKRACSGGGINTPSISIVNNRATGMREYVTIDGLSITKLLVKGHGHDTSHSCVSCSDTGGCVVADYTSGDVNSFDTGDQVCTYSFPADLTSLQFVVGLETGIDDRLLVLLVVEGIDTPCYRLFVEFDLSFAKLKQISLTDWLGKGNPGSDFSMRPCSDGFYLLKMRYREEGKTKDRFSLWDPLSGTIVHRDKPDWRADCFLNIPRKLLLFNAVERLTFVKLK